MLNLDQKNTNKLFIALTIAVFLSVACALSGWLVAFAAGYSQSLAAKDSTEIQTDLDRCEKDLEEAEDAATLCLDENGTGFLDSDEEDDFQLCGTSQNGETVFEDSRLQVFFTTPSANDCVDVTTYTTTQYIYGSLDQYYLSITVDDRYYDYYTEDLGYEALDSVSTSTADGIAIDIRTFKYSYDEYTYYNVVATTLEKDYDLGLDAYVSVSDESDLEDVVAKLTEFISTIRFNKARG
jgi:hypothetical protein